MIPTIDLAEMTLRDYHAANAPPPPDDFLRVKQERLLRDRDGGQVRIIYADEPSYMFEVRWRFTYADEMLRERGQ